MSKTIAVIGSTGQQGGAVAKAVLRADGWKVRGITRNVKGRGAQALASEGADMVTADIDDVDPLTKASDGVQAVFCVTNFWEHIGKGLEADAAGEKEAEQAFSIALTASKVPRLEHYVFSTLPKALDLTKGQRPVPQMDHKAGVDDRIHKELPDLAAKTICVWLGWYTANMAFMPLIRPFELPSSGGKYVWMQPSKADALLPICGDVGVNVGVYVRAALEHPEKSRGKYVYVRTDGLNFTDILKVWSEVSGKDADTVGPGGKEMAMQYQSGEMWDDWDTLKLGEVCTPDELGVKAGELVGLKRELEMLKSKLL